MDTRQNVQRKNTEEDREEKKGKQMKGESAYNNTLSGNKAVTKVWTWNLQKTSLAANNRGRLRRIFEYAWIIG